MPTRLSILFILALYLSVWLTSPIVEASPAWAVQRPESGGQVVAVHGVVAYRSNPHSDWAAASVGQVLTPGGQVRTGNEARATLYLANGEIVRLPPNSQLTLVEAPAALDLLLEMIEQIWAASLGQVAPTTTPNGVASIRG